MSRSIALLVVFLSSVSASALEPKEIFLLVNKNVPASKEVADHYCEKRAVPAANIILLDLPTGDDIARADYNARLLAPVREALKDKKDQAKVLLSIYGVPLRVGAQEPNEEEKTKLQKLDAAIKVVTDEIEKLKKETLESAKKLREQKELELNRLNQSRKILTHAESNACVDSELMLLWWDKYELGRWQINLLYWQIPAKQREGKPPIVMTCRIDAPSVAVAKRLIDQSVEVEKKGLEGKVYVDARGIAFDPKKEDGNQFGGYDESFREMAALLEKEGKMTVVLDDKETLFAPGSCPECALYCGWYSLVNYVDCCKFVPGAVAWHLASGEASSLRDPNPHAAKYWCRNLLDKGAVATLGPVSEPYTIGFPKPEEFFGFLATGKYTLVETYARTEMMCSWMTVLIGDPLYNPYAKNPRLKEEQVMPSPKGGRLFFGQKYIK